MILFGQLPYFLSCWVKFWFALLQIRILLCNSSIKFFNIFLKLYLTNFAIVKCVLVLLLVVIFEFLLLDDLLLQGLLGTFCLFKFLRKNQHLLFKLRFLLARQSADLSDLIIGLVKFSFKSDDFLLPATTRSELWIIVVVKVEN